MVAEGKGMKGLCNQRNYIRTLRDARSKMFLSLSPVTPDTWEGETSPAFGT